MDWMSLAIVSAALLGVYDIAKKLAARENVVPMVLFVSACVGVSIWGPLLIWQTWRGDEFPIEFLRVQPLTWLGHGMLFGKSVLVGASWTLALFALKHLPLSIAAPIRSTSPVWTIAIAVAFLGERPTLIQWLGIVLVVASFWLFSTLGRTEGIRFQTNRWVGCMLLATLLGAISSIYDKHLMQTAQFRPATVQAWFTIYMLPVMTPLAVYTWKRKPSVNSSGSKKSFQFRVSVLWISPLLLAADMVYFTAMANPDAMVSVVSTLRRCSVVVAIALGATRMKEVNLGRKSACVAGILLGAALILLAR